MPILGHGCGLLRRVAGGRRLGKFTFAHSALMRFARVFDVILELAVSLRQDRTYNVLSMRYKKTSGGMVFDCLAKLELVRHLIPPRPLGYRPGVKMPSRGLGVVKRVVVRTAPLTLSSRGALNPRGFI